MKRVFWSFFGFFTRFFSFFIFFIQFSLYLYPAQRCAHLNCEYIEKVATKSFFHLRLFFLFVSMDTLPRLLPDGEQASENNMMFLGIDVSPILSACIAVWLFLLELCLFLASNIQENFYFITSLVYSIIYNGVKYWLLNGPAIHIFLLGGYQGMEQRDICSLMKNLPSTYFLEGSGKDACDEAIHLEVTSRTTVVLTAFLTLFFVYGVPRFSQLLYFLWTYADKMRREQENREDFLRKEEDVRDDFLRRERQEREDFTFAQQEQRRKDGEARERNARAAVKRNQTMEKNAVLRQTFLKMITILNMNDVDAINKITEMRDMLDSIYRRQNGNPHYRSAIQEIDWQPKRWKIKGSSSTEVIIHQLENAIAEDISNANTDGEEDDADNY